MPPGIQASTEEMDVINTFRTLAELPPDSLGAYVISMARAASDVLAVVLLQVRDLQRCGAQCCRSTLLRLRSSPSCSDEALKHDAWVLLVHQCTCTAACEAHGAEGQGGMHGSHSCCAPPAAGATCPSG